MFRNNKDHHPECLLSQRVPGIHLFVNEDINSHKNWHEGLITLAMTPLIAFDSSEVKQRNVVFWEFFDRWCTLPEAVSAIFWGRIVYVISREFIVALISLLVFKDLSAVWLSTLQLSVGRIKLPDNILFRLFNFVIFRRFLLLLIPFLCLFHIFSIIRLPKLHWL